MLPSAKARPKLRMVAALVASKTQISPATTMAAAMVGRDSVAMASAVAASRPPRMAKRGRRMDSMPAQATASVSRMTTL